MEINEIKIVCYGNYFKLTNNSKNEIFLFKTSEFNPEITIGSGGHYEVKDIKNFDVEDYSLKIKKR